MRQVLQAAGGGHTRVAEVPAPGLRRGGVLVRTRWSLISAGTERMIIELAEKSLLGKARERPDLVRKTLEKVRREGVVAAYRAVAGRLAGDVPLGYSAAGEVLGVGDGVTDLRPGDRVACAGAGYANHAEVLSVPRNLCARVPEEVGLREACAATLGAIALHGVRTADVKLGETAVVVGLGLLGQLTVQFLRASGARVVGVDPDSERARLALRLGAEAVAGAGEDPAALVTGMTAGQGADAALVCAASDSSEPLDLAASLCRRRGVVCVVGAVPLHLDRRSAYEKELTLRMSTSYGPGRYDPVYEERGIDYPYPYVRWTERRNLEAFLSLLARKQVDLGPLLTHEYAIGDAERAYELVRGERREPFLGILLRYDADATIAATTSSNGSDAGGSAPARPRGGPVGLGFIGAGQFANAVLLPTLRSAGAARLVTVASASGSSAEGVRRNFGFARTSQTPDEVLAAPDVDAVVIATRHDSHAALAAAAIAAGKPAFVEKPLAIRPDQLAEVTAAMAKRPGLLCVGFNRRFAPAVKTLREELAGRTSPLHAHYRVNAGRLPATHWTLDPEVGGGRIVGEACHFLDLLAHLAGSRIARVQAERLGDDGAAVLCRLADGSTATLEYVTGGAASLPKEALELHWEGTSWVLDDFRRLVRHSGGRRRTLWSGAQDKGHTAELRAWLHAVADGASSPVPFDEAVATTEATFAVLDAMASGAPVDLGA